jgi:alkylation response protein AidB-like acyl-CoA dehydrogenase
LGGLDATISQLAAIHGLGTRPYVAYGSEKQKSSILTCLAKGEILSCFAQTEDGAGTHFLAMETVAVKSDKAWVINGDKVWIGNAGWSDMITLVAHARSAEGEELGMTVFAVPTDAEGVFIGEELNTMGLRGVVQNRIHFENLTLNEDAVIGDVGDGLSVAVDAMSFTRLVIAAQQIGLMKKAVQVMWKYAGERTISTGKLLDNAIGINFISESVARIDTMEVLLGHCARQLDEGGAVSPELSSICKILSTEFAGYVSDTALQLLGGRGYDENNIIPQLVRDTRVTRIFEGPTEALVSFVGSRIGSDTLARHLESLCGDTLFSQRLSDEIEDKVSELRADSVEFPVGEEQVAQWLHYQKGLLISWGVLSAAYSSVEEPDEDISAWLETGGADAPKFVSGHCFLSRDYLQAALERYRDDIGDVEQSLPALSWSKDVMV